MYVWPLCCFLARTFQNAAAVSSASQEKVEEAAPTCSSTSHSSFPTQKGEGRGKQAALKWRGKAE